MQLTPFPGNFPKDFYQSHKIQKSDHTGSCGKEFSQSTQTSATFGFCWIHDSLLPPCRWVLISTLTLHQVRGIWCCAGRDRMGKKMWQGRCLLPAQTSNQRAPQTVLTLSAGKTPSRSSWMRKMYYTNHFNPSSLFHAKLHHIFNTLHKCSELSPFKKFCFRNTQNF